MQHEHLLVIRFSAMGDVAMTVPVIWALARQYPTLRITVLSRPFARPFFEGLAPNVNFMEADLKGEYHGMKGLNALYRRLTAKQFTAIADLHNVLRSEYLSLRFHLGHFRVEHLNKHRNERRSLVAPQPKKVLSPLPSPFQNYLDVFRRLGYPIDEENLCFHSLFQDKSHPLFQDTDTVKSPFQDTSTVGLSDSQNSPGKLSNSAKALRIGIAPFAAHPGKTYPESLMLKVIGLLTEEHPEAQILLFGRGEKEDAFFARCCQQCRQCVSAATMAGNLHEELLLISTLRVMVSMDSSNMHLASLVATPVVSIWGATHPYAGFMGWGQSAENAIQIDTLDCRPCSIYGNKPCLRGDYACLNQISPEMVVEKINQVITKN